MWWSAFECGKEWLPGGAKGDFSWEVIKAPDCTRTKILDSLFNFQLWYGNLSASDCKKNQQDSQSQGNNNLQ